MFFCEVSMKHLIIPDTQVKPDSPTDHLRWAGLYAVKMRPDVIVHIGDHWDMPSLNSYSGAGCKSFEGNRYIKDKITPAFKTLCYLACECGVFIVATLKSTSFSNK